ncbi:MAG: glycoside hydrolase family 13 protein [Clostridia bacterium]|nr:glycoside hydrolase family 13 protein [Clostridia bacterium]
MDKTYFNSHNTYYRSPFGAVEQDTRIHFRALLPRNFKSQVTELCVKYDYDGDWQYINMLWCGTTDSELEIWECDFTPDKIGLYWYNFRMTDKNGEIKFIVPSDAYNISRVDSTQSQSWQITCYKKGFETPKWLSGGVMYQIFPDRFNFSGEEKDIKRTDYKRNNDWNALPVWQPNENGEITNNDFFMGDLKGIEQKLDYLKELGVTCIYLNPIFEAYSNHRYDTGDYSKIDPILGTEDDFKELCKKAGEHGIRIINDGVFSHTGADSVYFNRSGKYGSGGAYRDKNSPYFSWYKFNEWPDNYNSWWGFYTLPEVNETSPEFNEYINGKNGIIRKWMRCGNSGWRLDVADELPDEFMENLRNAVKSENPEAFIVGEVWEDASNKVSYGARRKFLLGYQLDSVMNYVFRNAILDFCRGQNARYTMAAIMSIVENYPRPVLRVLMNSLSTHDTERALTVIAGEPLNGRDRAWQASTHLTDEQRKKGIKLMKLAAAMQFTLPGFPCVYYGDEAGMEGYRDPFNRCCYPWGRQNKELLDLHRQLGKLRKDCSALGDGEFVSVFADGNRIAYIRYDGKSSIYCTFNNSDRKIIVDAPPGYGDVKPFFGSKLADGKLYLEPYGAEFLVKY